MGGRYRSEGKRRTPACVCDNCGRFDWYPLKHNNPCYWCSAGVFISSWQFRWLLCPCGDKDPFCPACAGQGYVPVPPEQYRDGSWVTFVEFDGWVEVVNRENC